MCKTFIVKVVRNICKFDSDMIIFIHANNTIAPDGNFRPPQNPHPLTDHKKIDAGDYVGGPYGYAKFGANPPMANG